MAHRSTKTRDSRVSSIWEFCNKLRFDKLLKFKRKLQFGTFNAKCRNLYQCDEFGDISNIKILA